MSRIAFLFPGQASQFVGMGLDFYNKSEIASHYYNSAEKLFDFSIKELSFYGPLKELTETKVTQPSIFTLSVAIFEELKQRGFLPDMVAGHSLGEYSALVAAGVVSFEEGLGLVKIRSEQMQAATESSNGTMAAIVGLTIDQVQKVLDDHIAKSGICNIANYNAPNQIVISGEIHALQAAMMVLKENGAKRAIELSVGGAFHSPLMEKGREKLKTALDATKFQTAQFPLYSNVTGTATTDPEIIKDRLYQQLTAPVLWVNTIENMIRDEAGTFVEVGPGKVLQGLVKRIRGEANITGVSAYEELEKYQ